MEALASGHSSEVILNKIALDPTKGTQETRILQYEEEVEKAKETHAVRDEILSLGKSDTQTISLPLKDPPLKPFWLRISKRSIFTSMMSKGKKIPRLGKAVLKTMHRICLK